MVRRNGIIRRDEVLRRSHADEKDKNDISKRQAGHWQSAVADMMGSLDRNKIRELQNVSVYQNKGVMQEKLKNTQQLIFINGIPHKVVFKQGGLERTALSTFAQQQLAKGASLEAIKRLSDTGIDSDAIVGIEKPSGWHDFAILASDPGSLFLN